MEYFSSIFLLNTCDSNCYCTCPADTKTAHYLINLSPKLASTPRYGHCLSPGVDSIYGSHMLPFDNFKLGVLVNELCWCVKVILFRSQQSEILGFFVSFILFSCLTFLFWCQFCFVAGPKVLLCEKSIPRGRKISSSSVRWKR